ncbi:ABC transporter [Chitiniphilus shinanonensis]|uniref:ABC transporter n=1 Tax=Chitiniphilus shinanonensis TaxID=553088 RepID=A0ABQ6BRP1_9NEIS|nr:type I secretion system permease/ATPase [Chitiniphilus shinanonensis]GLS04660.1 ABC transporter [Chitiniphilus shinanonensis]
MPTPTPSEHEHSDWNLGGSRAHFDPLLDCLVEITRIHGALWTHEALSAGLPLSNNVMTPSLVPRAAARAGYSARVVRRALSDLPTRLMPMILLLDNREACVLLEHLPGDRLRVRFPEGGEDGEEMSRRELETRYAGIAIFVRPRFRFEARAPELGSIRGRHWFWGVVFENWRLYRDTLLAAFLINVFALALPLFTMNVYDRVVPNHAVETLWVLAIGAMLVLGFDFAMRTVRGHIIDVASKRVDIKLSALIMERVLGIRMDQRPASVGAFAANLRAFEAVRDFITSASATTLIDLPFVFVFVLVLLWLSPWFIVTPLIGMVLIVSFTLLAQDKMHQMVELTQRAASQRNATLVESMVGIETIKALCAESRFQRRWEQATIFLAQVGARLRLLSTTTVNFALFIQQLVNIITIIVGVYLLTEAKVTLGGIIAASMLTGRALAPFGQVAGVLMQYQNARTSLAGLESQMTLPVELPADSNFLHRRSFKGDIEFRNVSFGYDEHQQTLKHVSFRLRAGERVAIIGRVGSGKSTIEKLLLGLYHPSDGAVLIDGIDTRQIYPAELRRAVGYVPQDPLLFYGTLRDNITLGSPFADDAMVLAAAAVSGVKEFADAHPRGFEMLIGERGESLSGGQRQAVCIARALVNDPPMVVLDEPTSSMDHQSEDKLKKQLRSLLVGKTVLLVTHRTSLLDLVDRMIVLDRGQIVADGPKALVIEALQQGQVARA